MIDERVLYAGTLVLLLVASGIAIGLQPTSSGPDSPDAAASEYSTTDEGVRYTVDPDKLRQGCPGGLDCIPSIDNPRFQPANQATWLKPSDRVIGVEIKGQARAYPLRILNVHEVVNDRLAGQAIAVTYCPLCRSGLVFSRRVNGQTLTFGVSGKLLDANLVLYDRQTETYWSQIRGEAIVGPLVPTTLTLRPSTITTWADWRRGHPDTQVLSRDTGIYPKATYGSNPYAGYANNSQVGYGVGEVDDRLSPKTLVFGLTVGGSSVAYPESTVRSEDVIIDEVGSEPVVVVEDPGDGGVSAFSRRIENETLTFRAGEEALIDQHGHRWSYDGVARSGPRAGEQLDRLATHGVFWFAWSQFHPDTAVYNQSVSE
ncbi:MAG: DUF3179 domain-containing protein [Halobacteriales archaeon]